LKALVAQMASDRLGFDLNVLERIQVPHAMPKKVSQQKTSSYPRSHRPQVMRLEHLLLQCLVHYPELAHDVVFPDSLELNEPLNDLSIVAHYIASLDEPPSFPQLLEYVNTLPCAERLQSVLKQSMQHQETIPERGAAKIYLQEGLDRAMKGLYRQQLQQLMFEAKQRSLTHQERLLLSALLQNSK
jgi:hypothetical protein